METGSEFVKLLVPVVTTLASLPYRFPWGPGRRESALWKDYQRSQEILRSRKESYATEAMKWQGYRVLLKGSAADLEAAPLVEKLQDAKAWEDYRAAGRLLVFNNRLKWLEFRAPLRSEADRKRRRWCCMTMYAVGGATLYTPLMAHLFEVQHFLPRWEITSVIWIFAILPTVLSLRSVGKLNKAEAFLERIERHRKVHGLDADNDAVMTVDDPHIIEAPEVGPSASRN